MKRSSKIRAMILGVGLIMTNPGAWAQTSNQASMTGPVWEAVNLLMYKMDKIHGKTVFTPYFPPPLKNLDGKTVELSGFLVPLSIGRKYRRFMLSSVPILQTAFQEENDIQSMIEVYMMKDKQVTFTQQAIYIKGKFLLNPKFTGQSQIRIVDAQLTEIPKDQTAK